MTTKNKNPSFVNVKCANRSVVVITPTTGSDHLAKSIESVEGQSYSNVKHVIVIDGKERVAPASAILNRYNNVQVISLPETTGDKGFQGHRIYSSIPTLLNSDYICFLDEDNWYEPNHVESLVELIENHGLDWAYSLRRIVRKDGNYVCNDDCNSLGRWPSYDGGYHHIDTSCYMLRRSVAMATADAWNRSDLDGTGAADRVMCKVLMSRFSFFHTTGKYTANYRLASRSSEAGDIRYYTDGNRVHSRLYNHYPWQLFGVKGQCPYHPHLDYSLDSENEKLLGGPLYATKEQEAQYVSKLSEGTEIGQDGSPQNRPL